MKLIDTWVKEEKADLLAETFRVISGLRIWQEFRNNNVTAYQLNETFRVNLQKALFGGGENWTPATKLHGEDKHKVNNRSLTSYQKREN